MANRKRGHNEVMLIGYRRIGTPAEDLYETCAPDDPAVAFWRVGCGERRLSVTKWRPGSPIATIETARDRISGLLRDGYYEIAYSDDLIPDKGPRPRQAA